MKYAWHRLLAKVRAEPPAPAEGVSLKLLGVAGASVRIVDAQEREVLAVPQASAVLAVDLPPGHYRALAVRDGRAEMRTFQLARGRRLRLVFDWPNVRRKRTNRRNDHGTTHGGL
jgi:hypothetical protein